MIDLASMGIIPVAVGRAAHEMAFPSAAALPPPTPEEREALLDQYGLSKGTILYGLSQLLCAERVIAFDNDLVPVPDNPTRVKAHELGLKLHGMIDRPAETGNIGTVNILFSGTVPSWANPTNNQMVNDSDGIPISTIEGTESAPAPSRGTRSAPKSKSKSLSNRIALSKGKRK